MRLYDIVIAVTRKYNIIDKYCRQYPTMPASTSYYFIIDRDNETSIAFNASYIVISKLGSDVIVLDYLDPELTDKLDKLLCKNSVKALI